MSATEEIECWRCGADGEDVVLPVHPDGGGTICHKCWARMFEEPEPDERDEDCGFCAGTGEGASGRPCGRCGGAGYSAGRAELPEGYHDGL